MMKNDFHKCKAQKRAIPLPNDTVNARQNGIARDNDTLQLFPQLRKKEEEETAYTKWI